jgi:hypothetical protein
MAEEGNENGGKIDAKSSSRELVDLSAESVRSLGFHLEQIGGLIAGAKIPKVKGDRGAPSRIKEKIQLFDKYNAELARRQEEVEARMASDFEQMMAWRKQAGTEGADLIKEIEMMMKKIKNLTQLLKEEKEKVKELRAEVAALHLQVEREQKKWSDLFEVYVKTRRLKLEDSFKRGGVSSWLQVAFDDVRFKFKAEQEKERLLTEHHRKMRKNRAQLRLDVILRERQKRQIQSCFLAMQEEQVEGRAQRHLDELRQKFDDEKLILEGQVAQLLGDEEKAKEIVAEQVRRMEEARRKQKEAEKQRDEYRKKMKKALEEKDEALKERDQAIKEKEEAIEAKIKAESERDAAIAAEQAALVQLAKAETIQTEMAQEIIKLKKELKKKMKKIESLLRIINELGAESDSDAPPDERAPPFFTNEDGSRVPRPRTRKERMQMAYREAESARCELRLGMAAMIDKDVNSQTMLTKIRVELQRCQRERDEIRSAMDTVAAEMKHMRAGKGMHAFEAGATVSTGAPDSSFEGFDTFDMHASYPGPPGTPLATSTAAAPLWSPTRPQFVPGKLQDDTSPRVLLKTGSQPILMPAIGGSEPTKITLAPLRTVKQMAKQHSQDFKAGWH